MLVFQWCNQLIRIVFTTSGRNIWIRCQRPPPKTSVSICTAEQTPASATFLDRISATRECGCGSMWHSDRWYKQLFQNFTSVKIAHIYNTTLWCCIWVQNIILSVSFWLSLDLMSVIKLHKRPTISVVSICLNPYGTKADLLWKR